MPNLGGLNGGRCATYAKPIASIRILFKIRQGCMSPKEF
jgi:hypothetical protein